MAIVEAGIGIPALHFQNRISCSAASLNAKPQPGESDGYARPPSIRSGRSMMPSTQSNDSTPYASGIVQQSAASYRQLVALRPGQATWQLGLAIALEQLDQPAEAARHYRLALQGSGLDDSARRFASERAAALGGRG